MTSRQQLASTGPTELAVQCQRVADNPSAYTATISSNALELKREWTRLQTKPDPDYEKQKKIDAQKADLKKRMVEFLSAIL
jgi:hypothetical protein